MAVEVGELGEGTEVIVGVALGYLEQGSLGHSHLVRIGDEGVVG